MTIEAPTYPLLHRVSIYFPSVLPSPTIKDIDSAEHLLQRGPRSGTYSLSLPRDDVRRVVHQRILRLVMERLAVNAGCTALISIPVEDS